MPANDAYLGRPSGRPFGGVLIVEDHDLVATTLVMALRSEGMAAESAVGLSSDEVVRTAQRLTPVLVLLDLDLELGEESGLDLVRPLRELGARVVMVTGVTDRDRLATCVEAGADGILSKTTSFAHLVSEIKRAAMGEPLLTDDEREALRRALSAHRREEQDRLASFDALTPREAAVLGALLAGQSAESIAAGSYVSLATVRTQIRAVLHKLGVTSQLAAVALARRNGWHPPAP